MNYDKLQNIKILLTSTYAMYNTLIFTIIMFISAGCYVGIFELSSEIQQSEYFRIIYVHVPSAWGCLLLYITITMYSILYLLYKNTILLILIKSNTLVGFLYSLVTLVTGSIWGKPTWGTWWVWDARLTSVLVLAILYIIILLLIQYLDITVKNNVIICIFIIIGFCIVPLVKYSVHWWTTLHQQSSITVFESSIHISIVITILIMLLSLIVYTLLFAIFITRTEILNNKLQKILL